MVKQVLQLKVKSKNYHSGLNLYNERLEQKVLDKL